MEGPYALAKDLSRCESWAVTFQFGVGLRYRESRKSHELTTSMELGRVEAVR